MAPDQEPRNDPLPPPPLPHTRGRARFHPHHRIHRDARRLGDRVGRLSMTYDQWKTTDPRDYEPEEEQEATELELVYEQLRETQETAKRKAGVAAERIARLEAAMKQVVN